MTVKHLKDVPYTDDAQVREVAVRLWRTGRDSGLGGSSTITGNESLLHAEKVARRLALQYLLIENEGGNQYAVRYAKAAALLGALVYHSSMAQSTVAWRSLQARLTEQPGV